MKKDVPYSSSRSKTPWTDDENATPLQSFIDITNKHTYDIKHNKVKDTPEEIAMLNTYTPERCGHCGSRNFMRYGKTSAGLVRFKCRDCGRTFNILTGTIFQNHKIPLTEQLEFALELFRYDSFNSISKSNRNSSATTKYWIKKLFTILKDYQRGILLSGKVYIDETLYKVRAPDIVYKSEMKEPRGRSDNQMIIGVGYDGNKVIALYMGNRSVTNSRVIKCYGTHIISGSTLIHDKEPCHNILVDLLKLNSIAYKATTKKIPDNRNPLHPIDHICMLLQTFLDSHSGFLREDIQGYLNLFCFKMNEGNNPYETVNNLLDRAIKYQATLSFRDCFR